MDRSQITGIVLLLVLFAVYYAFFLPETPQPSLTPEVQERAYHQDSVLRTESPTYVGTDTTSQSALSDSLAQVERGQKYGTFATAAEGADQEIVIENKVMKVTFSTRGADVKKVELKDFNAYGGLPLILIDEESSTMQSLVNVDGKQVNIGELFFTSNSDSKTISNGDSLTLTFTLNAGQGRSVVKTYVLDGESYLIKGQIAVRGFNGKIADNKITYRWLDHVKAQEQRIEEVRAKTTVNYYEADGSFDGLSENSDVEEETISVPVKWAAIRQKFFTAAIIADQQFNSGYFKTTTDKLDTNVVLTAEMVLEMPLAANGEVATGYTYYFGPNNFKILKNVTDGFEKNIYLGWPPVNFINRYLIIPVFHFLERFVGNYGVIILLLTIFIRIIISPLTYKSYLSMAKTKILKPELDAIKEKYKDDMQKAQGEQMQLYQKAGVNPLSGCIPMLLQMPILFAMFYFFPNSVELRHEPFLWAEDLSTYDSIISWSGNIPILSSLYGNHISLFTILMTLSTILYTWSNNQMTSVTGPMKSVGYVMPVVFMFVLNSFSAALTYYYFLSNIISFAQQAIIKRFVNEDKIKKIMEENKLKYKSGGKKSAFQQRLEEAMKAKNEATAARAKGGSKKK